LGEKRANPWIYLFDDQMNFSLDYDDEMSRLSGTSFSSEILAYRAYPSPKQTELPSGQDLDCSID
jgi:hypothetical protein